MYRYRYRFNISLKYRASVSIFCLFEVSRIGIDLLKNWVSRPFLDTGLHAHLQVTEQVLCFVTIVLECKGQNCPFSPWQKNRGQTLPRFSTPGCIRKIYIYRHDGLVVRSLERSPRSRKTWVQTKSDQRTKRLKKLVFTVSFEMNYFQIYHISRAYILNTNIFLPITGASSVSYSSVSYSWIRHWWYLRYRAKYTCV